MIKRLLRRWLDEPSIEDGLAETLSITIRCARRCAYDLKHAASFVEDDYWRKIYASNAEHWQSLFSSGTSAKEYRLELRGKIDDQKRLIEVLRGELRKLGHSGFGDDELPF